MGIGATADPLKSRSSASLVDTIMTFSPLLSRSRAVASTFGLLAAFGAATSAQAQVEIPDRFPELLALAAPDAAARIVRCVGQASPTEAQTWITASLAAADPDDAREFAPAQAPAVAIAARGWWTCVQLSPTRFPIYPMEVLSETIAVDGVSAPAMAAFFRRLLQTLAERGEARGLVVHASGPANRLNFKVAPNAALYLGFTKDFLKAGEFTEAGMTAVLRDPAVSTLRINNMIESTREGLKGQLAFPADRVFFPMEGDYLQPAPGPVNVGQVFENTRWISPQQTVFAFQPGGVVTMTSPRVTSAGTWEARDGVVRMKVGSGTFYTLRASADGKTLAGRARNTPRPPKDVPPGADALFGKLRHWTITLTPAP